MTSDEKRKLLNEQITQSKILSTSTHRPGDVVTMRDGRQYRVHLDGSLRRIKKDETT